MLPFNRPPVAPSGLCDLGRFAGKRCVNGQVNRRDGLRVAQLNRMTIRAGPDQADLVVCQIHIHARLIAPPFPHRGWRQDTTSQPGANWSSLSCGKIHRYQGVGFVENRASRAARALRFRAVAYCCSRRCRSSCPRSNRVASRIGRSTATGMQATTEAKSRETLTDSADRSKREFGSAG